MEKFNFEFTTEEINYILSLLSVRPYNEVVNIINNIQKQAKEQKEN